ASAHNPSPRVPGRAGRGALTTFGGAGDRVVDGGTVVILRTPASSPRTCPATSGPPPSAVPHRVPTFRPNTGTGGLRDPYSWCPAGASEHAVQPRRAVGLQVATLQHDSDSVHQGGPHHTCPAGIMDTTCHPSDHYEVNRRPRN